MEKKLISTVEEWMSQSDPDAWLREHPEHMESLAPYRNLDSILQSRAQEHSLACEPSSGSFAAGHTRLMAEVQGMAKPGWLQRWSAPARAGALAAVAVATLAMAAGASAAMGGADDLGQAVLDAVIGPSSHDEGINNAPSHADNGREHADENAFEGRGNADDKSLNGNGCQNENADVNPNANPNAAERCNNADDGKGNAGDVQGADHAADQSSQGSGNADTHPTPKPMPDVPADPPGRGGQ